MKYIDYPEYKHAHGTNKYKTTESGTAYHIDTDDNIVEILEDLRADNTRVRFHWGDVKTGKDWGDTYDIKGTIGRSTGEIKIPLLIHNSRSMGGGAILDHCIVKITTTKGNRVIYQHPTYHI